MDVLPQASLAVHVLVIVDAPAHAPAVVISAKVSVGLASHTSVAVAVAKDGVAEQSIVVADGNALITGGVIS